MTLRRLSFLSGLAVLACLGLCWCVLQVEDDSMEDPETGERISLGEWQVKVDLLRQKNGLPPYFHQGH